jgi:hypothetical protein
VEEPGKVRFFGKAVKAVDKRANKSERVERIKGDFGKVSGEFADKIAAIGIFKIELS